MTVNFKSGLNWFESHRCAPTLWFHNEIIPVVSRDSFSDYFHEFPTLLQLSYAVALWSYIHVASIQVIPWKHTTCNFIFIRVRCLKISGGPSVTCRAVFLAKRIDPQWDRVLFLSICYCCCNGYGLGVLYKMQMSSESIVYYSFCTLSYSVCINRLMKTCVKLKMYLLFVTKDFKNLAAAFFYMYTCTCMCQFTQFSSSFFTLYQRCINNFFWPTAKVGVIRRIINRVWSLRYAYSYWLKYNPRPGLFSGGTVPFLWNAVLPISLGWCQLCQWKSLKVCWYF